MASSRDFIKILREQQESNTQLSRDHHELQRKFIDVQDRHLALLRNLVKAQPRLKLALVNVGKGLTITHMKEAAPVLLAAELMDTDGKLTDMGRAILGSL